MIHRIWNSFLDVFYPQKCILCGKLLSKQELDLCIQCRMNLPLYQGEISSGIYISNVYPVFFYENTVRESILRYKFSGARYYSKYYGTLLATSIQAKTGVAYDGVVWVPVSRKRKRKRGYDQSYLLAEMVAKQLDLPLLSAVEKIRNNPAQSSVATVESRRANVMGVYKINSGADIVGKRLLLLDDIWTTGSTANEVARMLLTGGAALVDCGVVAATRER